MRLSGVRWRDTQRAARIFGVDARAVFPVFLFLVAMSWWTLGAAAAAIGFFAYLDSRGTTPPAAWRAARSWLAGPVRPVVSVRHQRQRTTHHDPD